MAFRLEPLLLASALLVLAVPVSAQSQPACGEPLFVPDAGGDQVVYPIVPAPDLARHPEMDLLGTSLALDGHEVVLTATLGVVPTADGLYSYRYWFGFHVKPATGAPEYMDVRMHGKDALAGAPLITSNEQGNERIASVVPLWNGTTATFRFAMALLHEVYGTTDLQVGQPEASTDGPFNQEAVMWFPTGIAYQVDHAPDGIGEWAAYESCSETMADTPVAPDATSPEPSPEAQEQAPAAAEAEEAPGIGFASVAGVVLGCLWMARRRLP